MGRRIRGTQQSLNLPSVDDIIDIHDLQYEKFRDKSDPGIFPTGEGTIDSLLYRIENHLFEGPYSTIVKGIAMLYEGIIRSHPFIDVNKRTGISTAYEACLMNMYYLLNIDSKQEVDFALKIASTDRDEIGIETICQYFSPRIIPYYLYGLEKLSQGATLCPRCGTPVTLGRRKCPCGLMITRAGINQKGIIRTYEFEFSMKDMDMYNRSKRKGWLKR